MTVNNHKKKQINHIDHTRFSGTITKYDFAGYTPMSIIASRIISDMRFDERCRMLSENKYRK